VVGYKTVGERKRWWHLAVEARPLLTPFPLFALRLHIIFSDDGKTIWDSNSRLHRARRSQGRSWWNDDWRDRGRGVMAWLADGERTLDLPIGTNQVLRVDISPFTIVAPVSCADPSAEGPEESAEAESLADEELASEDVA
jgi:hypothetical protein